MVSTQKKILRYLTIRLKWKPAFTFTGNKHQGDEIFTVDDRCKQCAFIILIGIQLFAWLKIYVNVFDTFEFNEKVSDVV